MDDFCRRCLCTLFICAICAQHLDFIDFVCHGLRADFMAKELNLALEKARFALC